jgi:N,N'-diacetyllegionaminate synthase
MFESVFIVAEAGSNHNGNLDTAVEMVKRAAQVGADAIKFQDFTLSSLFEPDAYESTLGLSTHKWRHTIDRLSVKPGWHRVLAHAAGEAGIHYFSTPFSIAAVDELDEFVPFYKIASGDITHIPLLRRVAQTGKGIFLSTGGSRLDEIDQAVQEIKGYSPAFICILHCIMRYPPPDEALHLNFIDSLKGRFDYPIGFSDHTIRPEAATLAVAKGARVIEKHFTLDREQAGADHSSSMDPGGFGEMVALIRRCENMLGDAARPLSDEESRERIFARRGIYAARDLKRSESIDLGAVDFLRPNIGIGSEQFDRLKNLELATDVKKGEPLTWSMFDCRDSNS